MAWTEERVHKLKTLWAEGLSASQIAGRLGGTTRNAVISKIHRMGLSGRVTQARTTARKPRNRQTYPKRPRLNPIPYVAPDMKFAPIPKEPHRTIATLEATECRWPIGDPQKPGFRFCGHIRVPGSPYCEFHLKVSRPQSVPKTRKEKLPQRPYNPKNSDIKEFEDA